MVLFNFEQKHTHSLIHCWKCGCNSSKECTLGQHPYPIQHINMASGDVEELYTNGDLRLSPAKHIVSWKCIRSPDEFSRMIHGLRGMLLSKCFSG